MIEKFKILCICLVLTFCAFNVCVAQTPKMNDSILYELLVKNNVQEPKIVIAQARIETGNYKSNLCVNHYNLFGIKLNGKYAHFKSYEESVLAYRDKIQYRRKSNEDYFHFLTRIRYAANPKYIATVKSVMQQIKI